MREVKVKSVVPVYLFGITWILCAFILPMYRWFDFVIALIFSILVFRVSANLIPPKTILVEKEPEPISTGNLELDEVLTTGTAYMSELSNLSLKIENKDIAVKIDKMMGVSRHIFEFVTKTPSKIRQIKQFMNYYLPTTIKLLKNYNEFQKQETKGENIVSAMGKIEGVLDTIVIAFKKVLDDLFSDKALDTSVDIEVLEKMIKDEGF